MEETITQMERNLDHSKKLHVDLDLIEQDIELIFKQSNQLSINEIQIQLEQSLNHCRTLSLPNCQIHYFLDKIDQLNRRLNTYLISSTNPSQVDKPIIEIN